MSTVVTKLVTIAWMTKSDVKEVKMLQNIKHVKNRNEKHYPPGPDNTGKSYFLSFRFLLTNDVIAHPGGYWDPNTPEPNSLSEHCVSIAQYNGKFADTPCLSNTVYICEMY